MRQIARAYGKVKELKTTLGACVAKVVNLEAGAIFVLCSWNKKFPHSLYRSNEWATFLFVEKWLSRLVIHNRFQTKRHRWCWFFILAYNQFWNVVPRIELSWANVPDSGLVMAAVARHQLFLLEKLGSTDREFCCDQLGRRSSPSYPYTMFV